MPINVEINETQAQSPDVELGQFRTDGEGSYGIVTLDGNDEINFLIVQDPDFNADNLPTINFFKGGDTQEIAQYFPYIVEGRIIIEGYRV